MKTKRPIDEHRDAAFGFTIEAPDDPTDVVETISLGDSLLLVKGGGIYEFRHADSIDPERTNPRIPNAQRRLLQFGSHAPFVGRTLLTTCRMLKSSWIKGDVDTSNVVRIVLNATHEMAAMYEIYNDLIIRQAEAEKVLGKPRSDRSLVLPAIHNLDVLVGSFLQRTKQALQANRNLAPEFLGQQYGKGWMDGLAALISKDMGAEHRLAKFFSSWVPFFEFIQNARNCVEHARPNHEVLVRNYELSARGEIFGPSIEIAHLKTPLERVSITIFMQQIFESVVTALETTIVQLCDYSIVSESAFDPHVAHVSHSNYRDHVRFRIHVAFGGQAVLCN